MKITKTIARNVANKMTKELEYKNQMFYEESVAQYCEKHLLSKLPKNVLDVFNSKHKEYLEDHSQIRLCGNGFNYEYVYMTQNIPMINTNVTPEGDFATTMRKNIDAHKKEKNRIEKLNDEIELTLLNLKTYKNVQTAFPEAAELLPPPPAQLPMKLDLSNIRKQLK